MAVTKIWPIKGRVDSPLNYVSNEAKTANPRWDKSSLANLTDVMHYATDEDKTEKQFFVTGINCNADTARDQFVTVKKQFDKEDGIVAYHGYQSFTEGEVTPEQAHTIGLELARRLWGDEYQVVVATHLNTCHYHNHFIVNSISFKHGKRLRQKQWYEINKVNDEICLAHGLSIVESRHGKQIAKGIYRVEQDGGPTRLIIAKAAIDEACSLSTNMKEMELVLKSMGYSCNFSPSRKHWTVKLDGWQRPIRIDRIGSDYTNERLIQRVEDNNGKSFVVFQKAFVVRKHQYKLQTRHGKINQMSGLKRLYLHYCYLLGYLPKYRQKPTRISPLLRDDLLKLESISEEVRFICKENITSQEQLDNYREAASSKLESKLTEQHELRLLLKRKMPEEQKKPVKEKLQTVNQELKVLRKELKLTERIMERSKKIAEKVLVVERAERKKNIIERY